MMMIKEKKQAPPQLAVCSLNITACCGSLSYFRAYSSNNSRGIACLVNLTSAKKEISSIWE
jgi:hypothetical protein